MTTIINNIQHIEVLTVILPMAMFAVGVLTLMLMLRLKIDGRV